MLTMASPMLMDELTHSFSKTSLKSPPPLWLFTPRTHIIRSDVFSRFVLFDGRGEVCGVWSNIEG